MKRKSVKICVNLWQKDEAELGKYFCLFAFIRVFRG
jgi:hypothetical protein